MHDHPFFFSHLTRIEHGISDLTNEHGDHKTIPCSTTSFYIQGNKKQYMKFDGFSTPVISFWLICTTRRWDRGSVWGHTLFLSELIFFSIHAKTHFFSCWRPSFDSRCEPCIVPKKVVNVFCLPTKIL